MIIGLQEREGEEHMTDNLLIISGVNGNPSIIIMAISA
jgi:hypothetical protein